MLSAYIWSSVALLGVTTGIAYSQYQQFYPLAVYLVTNGFCRIVIGNSMIVSFIVFAKILIALFMGKLTLLESELVTESLKNTFLMTTLALTLVMRDHISSQLFLLMPLLTTKVFHTLIKSRIDNLEHMNGMTGFKMLRFFILQLIFVATDFFWVYTCLLPEIFEESPDPHSILGFEYLLQLILGVSHLVRYFLKIQEIRRPEDDQYMVSKYKLMLELATAAADFTSSVFYFFWVMNNFTFPFHLIYPVSRSYRSFYTCINAYNRNTLMLRDFDNLFPVVPQEELDGKDTICIICRSPITSNARKLPCEHIFHTACLRSCFQSRQDCPICSQPFVQRQRPVAAPPAAGPAGFGGPGIRFGFGVGPPAAAAPRVQPLPGLAELRQRNQEQLFLAQQVRELRQRDFMRRLQQQQQQRQQQQQQHDQHDQAEHQYDHQVEPQQPQVQVQPTAPEAIKQFLDATQPRLSPPVSSMTAPRFSSSSSSSSSSASSSASSSVIESIQATQRMSQQFTDQLALIEELVLTLQEENNHLKTVCADQQSIIANLKLQQKPKKVKKPKEEQPEPVADQL